MNCIVLLWGDMGRVYQITLICSFYVTSNDSKRCNQLYNALCESLIKVETLQWNTSFTKILRHLDDVILLALQVEGGKLKATENQPVAACSRFRACPAASARSDRLPVTCPRIFRPPRRTLDIFRRPLTDASEEIPHYVIEQTAYTHAHRAAGAERCLSRCTARKFPPYELLVPPVRSRWTRSDAGAQTTKGTVIRTAGSELLVWQQTCDGALKCLGTTRW